MLGGVPIKVILPPNRAAKARGIRNFDGGVSIFSEMAMTAGNKMATAPMLFITADINPAVIMRMTIKRRAGTTQL